MSKVVLKCKNVCKKMKGKELIKNISFEVCEGDILGFIGPNGAGKSTTIKLILGLYKLDYGSIFINGYDLKSDFVKAISYVGAVIENPDMYMYMSGYDNLMISSMLYGVSNDRIHEIAKLVNLENRIYDKVCNYSLGMKQRLGIAQAIIHNPKLLILDEPTNGLDPEGIKKLKELLIKLSKSGMAIIVSSHILSELESFCNKVCIINHGVVIDNLSIDFLSSYNCNNYLMEVNDLCLNSIMDNYEIIDNSHVKFSASCDELNLIIKKIIDNNIKILEIKKEVLSLEDLFMSLVGGNTID